MQTQIARSGWSAAIEPALRQAARNVRRSSQMRGACSAQPLHEPERPDRNERESEKRSAGQESRHCAYIHDILQGVTACGFCSRRTSTCARSVTSSRPIRSKALCFKNLRRPDRKSPGFHGRKPLQPPRISHHGCNRTRSGNRTRRSGHRVEFASMRSRL